MAAGSAPISVVIVEDHVVVAETLAHVLDEEVDLHVAATFESAEAALAGLPDDVDVVLTDHRLGAESGVTLARELLARRPELRILMLTASHDEQVLAAALEAGCGGFLTKAEPTSAVIAAVRSVAAGEAVVSPSLLVRLLPRVQRRTGPNPELTPREREVLKVMTRGGTNAEIADDLGLALDTVRNHVSSILSKLGVNSKLQAVTVAIQRGLVQLDE